MRVGMNSDLITFSRCCKWLLKLGSVWDKYNHLLEPMGERRIGSMWLCGSNCSEQTHFVGPLGHPLSHKLVCICGSAQGSSKVGLSRAGYIDVGASKCGNCIGLAVLLRDQPGLGWVWKITVTRTQPGQFIPPFPEVIDGAKCGCIICIPNLSS